MEQLIESIAERGVPNPIPVCPAKSGTYEINSGHRRKFACEYLRITSIPAMIRGLNKNEAAIALVDSNLQREQLLPTN